jgi:hypothetical protein
MTIQNKYNKKHWGDQKIDGYQRILLLENNRTWIRYWKCNEHGI